jgi:DNA-binding CsgD family transcriptional regulator
MGEPPEGYDIHRKDGTKGYSPENCEWVEHHEHMRMKRTNYTPRPLTERQKTVLQIVGDSQVTYRDIAEAMGISVKGAYDHVVALVKKGYLSAEPGKARTIKRVHVDNVA